MARAKRTAEVEPTEENTNPNVPAPETPAEDVSDVGSNSPPETNDNDQTSAPEGDVEANAAVEQIEARKDAQLELDPADKPADGSLDPLAADDHQTGPQVSGVDVTAAAVEAQARHEEAVRNAFVKEIRAEPLDVHSPARTEDTRIVVETNISPDRSGDHVTESRDKIVMSDGVEEARMIDVQPEGVVANEFDLGNGIRQTDLK